MFEFRNRIPFSTTFQDIYFSPEHGLEETRHVFIRGNQLDQRWKGKTCFVIGETGFGTGLNFLATWQHWRQSSDRPDVLHYISIEKYPLTADQLRDSHTLFPGLAELLTELVSRYPVPYSGMHRIWLDQHRVCLTLCLMDVCSAFEELDTKTDCWYLDGFAPAKNPEMWTTAVYRHLARLSNPKASVATFTAAGHVRRGLSDAGFSVTKIQGYGRKREMTVGKMENPPKIRQFDPWRHASTAAINQKTALVIGCGIAGAQVARNLAQRGFTVEILEQHDSPAREASGNPRGIISPKLGAQPSIEEDFSINAYLAAIHQLSLLAPDNHIWSQCGVLNLVTSAQKHKRWKSITDRELPSSLVRTVTAEEASDIAGISLAQSALYFSQGGWISPRAFIEILLDHSGISVSYSQRVEGIQRTNQGWKIRLDNKREKCGETLIVCSGTSLSRLAPGNLPADLISGQTSFAKSTDATLPLRCVLQHDGYITPSRHSSHLIGATFQRDVDIKLTDSLLNQRNLEQQKNHLPDFASSLGELTTAHSATRVATATRFPLIGAVPDAQFFAKPSTNGPAPSTAISPYLPGLYVLGALGSRGFSSAALAAEILCSDITGEPSPVRKSIKRATEPVKWVINKPG